MLYVGPFMRPYHLISLLFFTFHCLHVLLFFVLRSFLMEPFFSLQWQQEDEEKEKKTLKKYIIL